MFKRVLSRSLHCADWDKQQDPFMSCMWQLLTHWNKVSDRFTSYLDVVINNEKWVVSLNLIKGTYSCSVVLENILEKNEYVNPVNIKR